MVLEVVQECLVEAFPDLVVVLEFLEPEVDQGFQV
jgi:hypothetical protein